MYRFAALPLGCAHDVEDPTALRYRSRRTQSVLQEISVYGTAGERSSQKQVRECPLCHLKLKIGKNPRFLADKWFRLALRNFIKSYRAYQPVRFQGRLLQPGKRDYEHRWTLIRREAEECGARSLLDIGCA